MQAARLSQSNLHSTTQAFLPLSATALSALKLLQFIIGQTALTQRPAIHWCRRSQLGRWRLIRQTESASLDHPHRHRQTDRHRQTHRQTESGGASLDQQPGSVWKFLVRAKSRRPTSCQCHNFTTPPCYHNCHQYSLIICHRQYHFHRELSFR